MKHPIELSITHPKNHMQPILKSPVMIQECDRNAALFMCDTIEGCNYVCKFFQKLSPISKLSILPEFLKIFAGTLCFQNKAFCKVSITVNKLLAFLLTHSMLHFGSFHWANVVSIEIFTFAIAKLGWATFWIDAIKVTLSCFVFWQFPLEPNQHDFNNFGRHTFCNLLCVSQNVWWHQNWREWFLHFSLTTDNQKLCAKERPKTQTFRVSDHYHHSYFMVPYIHHIIVSNSTRMTISDPTSVSSPSCRHRFHRHYKSRSIHSCEWLAAIPTKKKKDVFDRVVLAKGRVMLVVFTI